jgi:hypothetical protein
MGLFYFYFSRIGLFYFYFSRIRSPASIRPKKKFTRILSVLLEFDLMQVIRTLLVLGCMYIPRLTVIFFPFFIFFSPLCEYYQMQLLRILLVSGFIYLSIYLLRKKEKRKKRGKVRILLVLVLLLLNLNRSAFIYTSFFFFGRGDL